MNDLKTNKDGAIILCCGGKGCPLLKLEDDRVIITDDDGNTIDIIKKEGFKISSKFEMIPKKDEPYDMATTLGHGIINFSKQLASYYGKYDIRVNAICPGGIQGHVKGKNKKQDKKFVKNY